MNLDSRSRPALAPGVRMKSDLERNECVLLYPEGFLSLNDTARAIVELCNGKRTLDDMVAQLADEFDAPPDELRADIVECLQMLTERRLVQLLP